MMIARHDRVVLQYIYLFIVAKKYAVMPYPCPIVNCAPRAETENNMLNYALQNEYDFKSKSRSFVNMPCAFRMQLYFQTNNETIIYFIKYITTILIQ